MLHIAHIINPVAAEESSHFFFIQQVTFTTMQTARQLAQGQVDVTLVSAQYPEDHTVLPKDFLTTPDLEHSVMDYGQFQRVRKLPLIKDILDRLYEASDAEYFIYTNVDIGLMPFFYQSVTQLISSGYDAFTINRRTIPDTYHRLDQIPLLYTELGETHRGWDCFVYRRDAYPHYKLGNACIGAPLIGLLLTSNLLAFSDNFTQVRNTHLTFHLGNDRSWHRSPYEDYAQFNKREILRLLLELDREIGGFNRHTPPGAFLNFHKSRWRAYLYGILMRLYIPAKITHPFRKLLRR